MLARIAICLFIFFFAGAAFAEDAKNRVALVIGNAAYKRAALANPVNDAKLMAARLKAQGFEVSASYDLGQRDMKRAVQTFAAALRERGKDAVAFIFYAGHGVQVKGENYLIPVDEQIKSEADVDIDAVSLSSIMSMLENTQTRLAIVVLDACRDNPFGYARGGCADWRAWMRRAAASLRSRPRPARRRWMGRTASIAITPRRWRRRWPSRG